MKNVRNNSLYAFGISVLFFYFIWFLVASLGVQVARPYGDQVNYYYPSILHFENSWDISSYPSAVAPGYFIFLGKLKAAFNLDIIGIRLISSSFTALLFGLVSFQLGKRYSKVEVLILLTPMMLSIYVLPSGIWLLPDNVSWLLVFLIIWIMFVAPPMLYSLIIVSILLACSIFFRQNNLWLALPVFEWITRSENFSFCRRFSLKSTVLFLIVTAPACFVVLFLYLSWGGLTPREFQGNHVGVNISSVPFFFTLIPIYLGPFIGFFLSCRAITVIKAKKRLVILIGVLALAFCLVVDTTYDASQGRYSGTWNVIRLFPAISGRSVLVLFLCPLGAMLIACYLLLFENKWRNAIGIVILAFIVMSLANNVVYERYYSAFIYFLPILGLYFLDMRNDLILSRLRYVPLFFLVSYNICVLVRGAALV